jgi:hypothetical protein
MHKEIFSENGKLNRFIVARIYSRKHLKHEKSFVKKVKEIKDVTGSNISAMNLFEGANGVRFTCRIQPLPNTVTNALNMELITVVKTSILKTCIQKYVLDLPSFMTVSNKKPFIPSEHNNVTAYILVGAPEGDGTFVTGGTFQAPTGLSLIAK